MEHRTIQLVHLSIGFLLASPIVYSAEFAGGTGTAADPYQIATAEQLMSIGSDPNLLNKHFLMIDDIDLDPNISTKYIFERPIVGAMMSPFLGVFDGAGFRIRHLTIVGSNQEEYEHLGLFDAIAGSGEVRHLILENAHIISKAIWSAVGLLCAANDGAVFRCSVSGVVHGNDTAGGLAGWNYGMIAECSSDCVVSAYDAGGLIGYNKGRARDCYAAGRVSGVRVGGLTSDSLSCSITHCYAICQVEGADPGAGGLVGSGYSSSCGMNLTDSYFLDPCDGGGPDNGTGTPLSRAQMKQPNSYAGWDFWGIGNDGFRVPWFMPEDGYPRLVWTALSAVPDVGGLPIERAATMLEGAGIHVDQIVYDYDHTAQDRYVITASPSPAVPPGSVMNLILSLGPYDWSTNSGTGDSNSPYLVISPGQLDCLAHQPQLWSRRFKLISDLDMKWRVYDRPLLGWSEVSRSVFDGIFDGNGHIISNLTIDADSTDGDMREMLGLFGEIGSSGSVKDLGLVDVLVGARRYQEKTAGMLCAVNGGHIERCYGRGVLQGYGKLGGLAGSNTGVVEDCYTGGEIKAWPSWGDGLYAGLVAENTVGAVRTSYTTCLVSSSFGAGLVAFTGSGPVEHSLWDVETSGVQTSKGGMGVTTSQLMDMEFLRGNGWGGNPNWIIDDGKDYPHLIWEGMPGSLIPEKPRR